MATAVLAPAPVSLRRRMLRSGSRLLAKEAADFVNVPATANLARALREWAASLKAPAANDKNAQEQATCLAEYAEFATTIAEKLSKIETSDLSRNGTTDDVLVLFGELSAYLLETNDELLHLLDQPLAVKFACQDDVKRMLEAAEEDSQSRIVMLSFKNSLLANAGIAQSQADIQRLVRHIELASSRSELVDCCLSRVEDQQLGTNEMLRQQITREATSMLQARQTNEQRCVVGVVLGHHVVFF